MNFFALALTMARYLLSLLQIVLFKLLFYVFGVSLHDWDQSSTDSKSVDEFEQYWKKLLGQEDAHLK